MSREEATQDLFALIKTAFEENGVLQEARSLLQTKMVSLINDDKKHDTETAEKLMKIGDRPNDTRLQLLNQLIMEYLHWHGFSYAAETFAMESTTESSPPNREVLESMLGSFGHKNLPILLEIIAELFEKQKS